MPFNFAPQQNFGSGLTQGATNTLQNFIMPMEEERQKSKLTLQMLSQRMGMEAALKQQEAQAQSQLQNIPANEMSNIGSQVSDMLSSAQQHKPFKPWDMSGITSTAGQQAALKMFGDVSSSIGRITGGNRPSQVKTTDAFGNQTINHYDPYSGTLLSSENGGLSAPAAAKVSAATNAYHQLNSLADRLNNSISSFQTGDNALDAAWQSGKLKLNQYANSNPAAKAFMDALPQDSIALDKAAYGSVRASPELMKMSEPAIFSPNDTFQTTALKVKRMRQMAYDNLETTYKSYGPTALPPGVHNPSAEDANRNAAANSPAPQAGKLSAGGFAAWKAAQDAQQNAPSQGQ